MKFKIERAIHAFRIRSSVAYRAAYLERKRKDLGCKGALPARFATLPEMYPFLSDRSK